MEETKKEMKVYVHYEGSPEYTHVARITWGLTVEQLAVEFTRVYNAKHGRLVYLDPAMIHLLNGRRRMSKTANLIRLVKDRSDIFVEREIPSSAAGLAAARQQPIEATVSSKVESSKSKKELLSSRDEAGKLKQRVVVLQQQKDRYKGGEVVSSGIFDQEQELAIEADLASAVERVSGEGQELQEPFICALLVSAVKAQQLKKYKFAGNIFSKVLDVLPKQKISLRGLGSIALVGQKYSEAVEWLQRGVEEYPRDSLFHARLGDAYSGLGKYDEALSQYDLALGLVLEGQPVEIANVDGSALSNVKVELGVPQNVLERLQCDPRLVQDPNAGDFLAAITVDGLQISSAAALGKQGKVEAADHILKSILAQNAENWDALYEYGTLLFGVGHVKEALKIFLKLLVSKPENKSVRSSVSKAIKDPQGMDILKKQVAVEPSAAPVLAYLASCVKDYGAVEEAIELYVIAIRLSPLSVGYYLSLIHLYEVMYEYLKALGLAISLFGSFPSFSLSKLQFSDIMPYFEGPNWTESPDNISQQCQFQGLTFQARAEFFRWFDELPAQKQTKVPGIASDSRYSSGESKREGVNCSYDDPQLDGLAVLFTVAKILFVGGALERAQQLARLIEPARLASSKPLHQTLIRNEAAYFTSVKQILDQYPIPLPLPPLKEQVPLYLAGDSHCLSAAWRKVRLRSQNRLLVPMLVTGLKVWHLRPESQFYPKYAFENVMQSVADGSQLVMVYGEIDCRESILAAVEKGIYKNVEHGVEAVVNIYLDVLQQLIFSRGFELFVHPVPPVLNETRAIVLIFNRILKGRLEALKEKSAAAKRIHWLDFAAELLTAEGLLKEEYKLDGTHLSPNYSKLLRRELGKVK
ncbi:unnamed protein product [Calypogeia fissa]